MMRTIRTHIRTLTAALLAAAALSLITGGAHAADDSLSPETSMRPILQVSITGPATVRANGTATYTARVSNVGTAPAQLVEVQISGPGIDVAGGGPQFTSISATGGGFGNCSIQFPFIDPNDLSKGASNLGLCRSQSLAAGASGQISLVVNYTIPPQTQLPLRTGLGVQAFTPDVKAPRAGLQVTVCPVTPIACSLGVAGSPSPRPTRTPTPPPVRTVTR